MKPRSIRPRLEKENRPTECVPIQTLSTGEIRDLIARRAYEIYESRGRQDGHDLENWLRAESELLRTSRGRCYIAVTRGRAA